MSLSLQMRKEIRGRKFNSVLNGQVTCIDTSNFQVIWAFDAKLLQKAVTLKYYLSSVTWAEPGSYVHSSTVFITNYDFIAGQSPELSYSRMYF